MKIEELMKQLEGVRKSGYGYTARCPHHEDKNNSLGISDGDDGKILIKCYAGCETKDVVSALGLSMSDLMPPKYDRPRNPETSYKLHVGIGDTVEHIRIDEPGGKRFIWKRNGKMGLGGLKVRDLPLYRPKIHGDGEPIVCCEGEKSAIAAGKLGLNAYGTACGASSCPSESTLAAICRGKKVVLWSDNDKPGKEHMWRISSSLGGIAKSVKVITTGGAKDDAADFRGTIKDFQALIAETSGKAVLLADKVDSMIDSLARYSNGDNSGRVPTGIKKIDYALRGGMMPGALYLLGAPSGHGKTTLLQGITSHVARFHGPVLFVSPEMSGEELVEREAIRESAVSVNQVAPWANPNERVCALGRLENSGNKIKADRLPIYIIEDPNVSMSVVAEIAAEIENLKLVVIDYAQEIANRTATTARYLAVGEVGKDSIVLGKDLKVPVMVASQVNVGKGDRGVLEYAFRETKDLEHRAHASMIMEVNRYQTPNEKGFFDVESARIFARKNRSGPLFDVKVDYKPEIFSITDYSEKPWVPRQVNGGY